MQTNEPKRSGRKGGGPTPGSFKPGHKINTKANAPRGRFITQRLINTLHAEMRHWDPKHPDKKKTQVIVYFVDKLIQLALDGDTTAIKLVMDRIEGTAMQTVQFREIPEGEETPEMFAAMDVTRQKLAEMTEAERIALYRQTLTETGRTSGSA